MGKLSCIAMILAGGRGARLGGLARFYSKPAIYFGGNHRIIDFTLNNCYKAGIGAIGVLSQYFTTDLNEYISAAHSGRQTDCRVYMLPSENADDSYKGTADAVFRNIPFVDLFEPDNVMILSGDHVYTMDYNQMLDFHVQAGADVTVASTPVPMAQASRFGVLHATEDGRVVGFEEKPAKPKSNLASMGVYIFKWSVLKRYLEADSRQKDSAHDFGKNIIPGVLHANDRLYTYRFHGYWRDVGTVASLWESNMDLIENPALRLPELPWGAPGLNAGPDIIVGGADVRRSIVSGDCTISGMVDHSVLGNSVTVGRGAEVVNSVIMPNVYIGDNARVYNTVVGTRAIIMDGAEIGTDHGDSYFVDKQMCAQGVSLLAPWLCISEGMRLQSHSHIYSERLSQYDDMVFGDGGHPCQYDYSYNTTKANLA